MPRKDRSFTAGDVVRIWCDNLDDNEQKEVFLFFFLIVPGILLTNSETLSILDIMKELAPNFIYRGIVMVVSQYLKIIRLIINSIWAELIFSNKRTKKEVIKCITKRV